ncbi:hypothetical protein [Streptomyces montanisoli]|uniref:Uncharacterized protein n=1 Tax=Streptomyces montanisoli TaxID=2798581 RepID=A0A940M941_9ACTN|nr:hypothetical protein [Streptomyces montanisoli]MBP0456587.1 hypothetical protein [Streptomyces montanisoli]
METAFPPIGRGGVPLDETPVTNPAKNLVLRPSPSAVHQSRLTARAPSPAELFHVNSGLSPSSAHNRPLDADRYREIATWFHSSAFAPDPDEWDPAEAAADRTVLPAAAVRRAWGVELPGSLGADGLDLLYGSDLMLLVDGRLYRWFPDREWLFADSRVAPSTEEEVRGCLLSAVPRGGALLFVVGVAPRYTALQGPRGYRRLLLTTGRLVDRLVRAVADAGGVRPPVVLDFHDDRLHRLLGLDGVERAVLAVLPLPWPAAASEDEHEEGGGQ